MPENPNILGAWVRFMEVVNDENYELCPRDQDDDENAPEGSVRLIWMEPETLWAVPQDEGTMPDFTFHQERMKCSP